MTIEKREAKLRESTQWARVVFFSRHEDGKIGPLHTSLAGAVSCRGSISRLINRRGVCELGITRYISTTEGVVHLIEVGPLDLSNAGQPAKREGAMTDKQILDIRASHANGETQKSIAYRYGISQSYAGEICRGDAYAHVSGPIRGGKGVER